MTTLLAHLAFAAMGWCIAKVAIKLFLPPVERL